MRNHRNALSVVRRKTAAGSWLLRLLVLAAFSSAGAAWAQTPATSDSETTRTAAPPAPPEPTDSVGLPSGILLLELIDDNVVKYKRLGFQIGPDTIVTTAHGLDRVDRIHARLTAARFVRLQVVNISKKLDMAILRGPLPETFAALKFSKSAAFSGTIVRNVPSAGSGSRPMLRSGAISRIIEYPAREPEMILFLHNALITVEGFGGPLLNECNEIVGLNRPNPSWSASRARRARGSLDAVYALSGLKVQAELIVNRIEHTRADAACIPALEADAQQAQRAEPPETVTEAETETIPSPTEPQPEDTPTAPSESDPVGEGEGDDGEDPDQGEVTRCEEEEPADGSEAVCVDETEPGEGGPDGDVETVEEAGFIETYRNYLIAGLGTAIAALLLTAMLVSRNRSLRKEEERANLAARENQDRASKIAVADSRREDDSRKLREEIAEVRDQRKTGLSVIVDILDDNGATVESFEIHGDKIEREGLTVGRREGVDILVKDESVSRRHASIRINERGTLTVRDESSLNGTFVGGQQVPEGEEIECPAPADLQFGDVVVRLRIRKQRNA